MLDGKLQVMARAPPATPRREKMNENLGSVGFLETIDCQKNNCDLMIILATFFLFDILLSQYNELKKYSLLS